MNRITRFLLGLILLLCLMWGTARPGHAQVVVQPVASVSLSGQLAAITATSMWNTGTSQASFLTHGPQIVGAGMYRATMSVVLTAVGTAGTISAGLVCNNGLAAVTQTTGTITTTAAVGTEVDAVFTCYAGPAQAIQYQTTFTGVTGTPAYQLRIRLEWLQ